MANTPVEVIEEEKKPRRQSCTDHCGVCDRHFSGLGAFDAHRKDGECLDPAAVVFLSGPREGLAALNVWTETGACDHVKGNWKDGKRLWWAEPVTVWQKAVTEEQRARMQAAFEMVQA